MGSDHEAGNASGSCELGVSLQWDQLHGLGEAISEMISVKGPGQRLGLRVYHYGYMQGPCKVL